MAAVSSVSQPAAGSVVNFNAKPINYGVNHLYWDMPSDTFPWTTCTVTRKFGGYPTVSDPGEAVAEFQSNSLFIGVDAATSTTSGFNLASYTGGGSVQIASTNTGLYVDGKSEGTGFFALSGSTWVPFADGATSANLSFTNGGTATIGTYLGGISTYSMSTGANAWSSAVNATVTASGGSGSGAKFRVSTGSTFIPNFGYTLTVTLVNPGTGYVVGNNISISVPATGGPIPFSFQVTSVTTQSANKVYYPVTQTSTSGSGSGAQFAVLRSGVAGTALPVTGVVVTSGGTGYAVGDTVTIAGSSIGSSTNLVLKILNTSTVPDYTATKIYENVVQSSTSGSGTGAKFDIYRVGLSDTLVPVTKVVVKAAGTGYATSSTITIAGASVGSSTDLVLTCSSTLTSASGNITAVQFGSALDAETWWDAELPIGGTLASDASVVYTNVPAVTAYYKGATAGYGATFNVTRNSSGVVTTVAINNPGIGYTAEDLLVIPSTSIGWNTISTPSFGVTSDFHFYDLGSNFSEEAPGKYFTSTYHQGKEVYYGVTLTLPYESATAYKDKNVVIVEDSVVSIKEQGTLEWLLSHLPFVYSTLDTNEDLKDFLSLFAFYIDIIKTDNNLIFNKYNTAETPASLIKMLLKQFGGDYNNLQSVDVARRVVSNAIKSYSQKGSVDGIYTLLRSYAKLNDGLTTSNLGDIYVSRNKVLDVNSCNFLTGTGYWQPNLVSTLTTTVGGSVSMGLGYDNSLPYSTCMATEAAGLTGNPVGYVKITNRTAGIVSMNMGPRKFEIVSVNTGTNSMVVKPGVKSSDVGKYIFTSSDEILPGTKVLSIDDGASKLTLDTAFTGTPPSAGDTVWLSDVATDTTGVLCDYIPVIQGLPYRFRLSAVGSTSSVQVLAGIIWRDKNGTAINYKAGSFVTLNTSTYVQVSVMGTAPAEAVYAEPYFRANFNSTNTTQWFKMKEVALWSPEKITSASRASNIATVTYRHIGVAPSVGDAIIVANMSDGFDTTVATVASVTPVDIGDTSYTTITLTYSNTGTNVTVTTPTGYIISDVSGTSVTSDKYPGYYDVVVDVDQSTADEESTVQRLEELVRDFSRLGRAGVDDYSDTTEYASGVVVDRGDFGTVYQITYTLTTATTSVKPGHLVTVGGYSTSQLNVQNEVVIGVPSPTTFVVELAAGPTAAASTPTGSGTATFIPLMSGLVAVTPHTDTPYDV